ncbi:MAG TPA: TolC family protein, partial [Kofleriaceae bacterium]|nr:TolC family protein [Kofleriaceae bacterium]
MQRYVFLLAALFATPAFGQPSILSLRQSLDYAHQHQPSLIAARARVEVARAQALVPQAAKAFRVGAAAEILGGTNNNTTASYATLGFLDVARIGGTPANAPVSWAPNASTIAGISVHKELYDFGRLDLLSDAFGAQAQAANETARASALDLDLLVEESFYAVLGAKAVLSASEAAVTRSTAHRDFARARVNAQLMPPIELARAEADLARYQVDQVRAQGALSTAQAVLAAGIGASAPAIDAGTDDVVLREPSREALGDVEARSPEMRSARDQLDAQRLFTRSIRAEMRPDLGLSAELTGRAGGATVTTNATPA